MSVIAELKLKQVLWENGFRKRYPSHPALALIDGLLKLDRDKARAIESNHTPYGDASLVSKARAISHAVAGDDFQGLVAMVTNAALRAAPDDWESVEIFRLGAAADAALWAILAQDSLKPNEYEILTRSCAVSIPSIKTAGGLPDKEEPVVVEVVENKVEAEPSAEATEATEVVVTAPSPQTGSFIVTAQKWADANPELFAEFVRSKMGYVGGAFSYTCEKVIKEAGHESTVGRGQRALAAFALFAEASSQKQVLKIKIAAKWWEGREVVVPE